MQFLKVFRQPCKFDFITFEANDFIFGVQPE